MKHKILALALFVAIAAPAFGQTPEKKPVQSAKPAGAAKS